jgi:MinD-like ATPase involved in chromosome partitioning or flagellar assembly
MPGTVVTFYSYKGGVGRSFTLANIAVLLARWGYRVLCLDWDLEAPGLHHYFRSLMDSEPDGGVVDLVDDFLAGGHHPSEHVIHLTDAGALDLIAAGRHDEGYVRRVQDIDWDLLYDKGFGDYIERCRERWTADYDYVLLDSRTGVSDIGSICTAHLPDHLVLLFTANKQSVEGAVDIARRANIARDGLPYDRPRLTVLPVLSRFDTREEYARSQEWRRICLDETRELFGDWLHREVQPEVVSRHLTLPYVSYWSFGEQLAVRSEPSPGADQISFALETVASVIAHRFDRTDLLAENRDAYVAAARLSRRSFDLDVRVSTPQSTKEFAARLVAELGRLGIHAVRSLSGDQEVLSGRQKDARHICLLVDGQVSRWQSAEVDLFVHRSGGQDRRVIPVLTEATGPQALSGYLGNLRYLRLEHGLGPAELATRLVNLLNGAGSPTDNGGVDLVRVLRGAAEVKLRPMLWELVDEIVQALEDAVRAGDDARARELSLDLALTARSRGIQDDVDRVPAPLKTRTAIKLAVDLLDR